MEEHFDEKKEEIISGLKALSELLFRKGNVMISYTTSREGLAVLEEEIGSLKEALYPERTPESRCILHCERMKDLKLLLKYSLRQRQATLSTQGRNITGHCRS